MKLHVVKEREVSLFALLVSYRLSTLFEMINVLFKLGIDFSLEIGIETFDERFDNRLVNTTRLANISKLVGGFTRDGDPLEKISGFISCRDGVATR